jgi:molecular chaperone HtpG
MSEKGKINIQSHNIFPIIKKWLYSEKEIFLRELVSNSIDAITKLKILATQGKLELTDEEFKVTVKISEENKTITIEDNGLGMTKEEIIEYLGQMAFSGAEEFISNYESDGDQIIGHFGLGFYSCFMVSKMVTVDSLSWKEDDKPTRWECDGNPEYTLSEGKRTTRGTTITLQIADDEKEFLDSWKLRDVLRRYCRFLPNQIFLDEELINPDPPIWSSVAGDLKDEDYIDFYKKMYPMEKEPQFWVHINADYPFKLQGVLYFPYLDRHDDLRANKLNLYCNRVFVSSDMNVILPEALSYMRGFIDSPDIPLNVSRSFLQEDNRVRKIASFITKKIATKLVDLRKEDEEKFLKTWENINPYVKLASIRDQKFSKGVSDAIVFETTGDKWLSINEILTANYGESYKDDKETEHFINYSVSGETLDSLIELYTTNSQIVIKALPPMDSHFFQHLEGKHSDIKLKFRRIDSELGTELQAEAPTQIVDNNGKTGKERIEERLKTIILEQEIITEWLKTDDLPLILIFPELERRFREMSAGMPDHPAMFNGKHKVIVNLNHNLIKRLDPLSRDSLDSNTAKEVISHIYNLSLLPHKILDSKTMDSLFVNAGKLLAHLSIKKEDSPEKQDSPGKEDSPEKQD